MNSRHKSPLRYLLAAVILLTSLLSTSGIGYAQNEVTGLTITATVIDCGDVVYAIDWTIGSPPYLFVMDYGDGITTDKLELDSNNNITLNHTYLDHGDYEWTVRVYETIEEELVLVGTAANIITLNGPEVTLSSLPFPPLLVLGAADDTVVFTATVIGGIPPYSYNWDRDGVSEQVTADTTETVDEASFIFSGTGKYQAQVSVTDDCNFSSTDSLPVVVSDPGDMCHPTAQKIADAVNTIFPAQAGDLYACEEIYDIFDGDPEGSNVGFGRMWKAYNLALTMEELTWEEIRDWHLDTGGWGALLQLDRFSDLLETHSLPDLMGLVISEEFSLGDVRTAVRSVTRFEADFEDALSRITEGANPGELGQLYELAADLEVDPSTIDDYLADGLTLAELKHTGNIADRMEVDWIEIADARATADSWGEINQAYKLATDDISAAEILIHGIQKYRKDLQEADQEERAEKQAAKQDDKEDDKEERADQQAAQQNDKNQQTANKLAEQYPTISGLPWRCDEPAQWRM